MLQITVKCSKAYEQDCYSTSEADRNLIRQATMLALKSEQAARGPWCGDT
jgi:hypothetical protein